MGDYTTKAQELLRGRSTSPVAVTKQPKEADFPAPPKGDFVKDEPVFEDKAVTDPEEEPLIAA